MSMELVLFLLILYMIVRRIILLQRRNVPRDRPTGPWPYEEPDFDWQDSVLAEEEAPVAHAPVPRGIRLSRPDHLQSGSDNSMVAYADVDGADSEEMWREGYTRQERRVRHEHERQAAQEKLAAGHTRPFSDRILPAELANGFIWSQILDQRGGRQAQRRRHN